MRRHNHHTRLRNGPELGTGTVQWLHDPALTTPPCNSTPPGRPAHLPRLKGVGVKVRSSDPAQPRPVHAPRLAVGEPPNRSHLAQLREVLQDGMESQNDAPPFHKPPGGEVQAAVLVPVQWV